MWCNVCGRIGVCLCVVCGVMCDLFDVCVCVLWCSLCDLYDVCVLFGVLCVM